MEIVTIDMNPSDRIRLDGQVNDRMEELGIGRYKYRNLELGFELPLNWPADMNCELTLAQLVVVANKLKMQIIISDLNLEPRKD